MTYEYETDDGGGRECEICGRGLRTGRKYCYEHRSQGRVRGKSEKSYEDNRPSHFGNMVLAYLFFIVLPCFILYITGVISSITFYTLVVFYLPIILVVIYAIYVIIKVYNHFRHKRKV